jgi:Zn-dependent membrane protease YugP
MSLWGWYIDPVYFLLFVVTLLISIGAQIMVSSAYRKWSGVKNGAGLTGGQVGQRIIQKTGLGVDRNAPVRVETPELQKLADLRDKGIVTPEEYEAKRKQLVAAQGHGLPSPLWPSSPTSWATPNSTRTTRS